MDSNFNGYSHRYNSVVERVLDFYSPIAAISRNPQVVTTDLFELALGWSNKSLLIQISPCSHNFNVCTDLRRMEKEKNSHYSTMSWRYFQDWLSLQTLFRHVIFSIIDHWNIKLKLKCEEIFYKLERRWCYNWNYWNDKKQALVSRIFRMTHIRF